MLWFFIHHLVQTLFPLAEDQTRNLLTFLSGTVLYVLFYSYLGSLDFSRNFFGKSLFNFFYYIVLADGFAMAIIYKNYYKHTILNEVRETIGAPSGLNQAAPVNQSPYCDIMDPVTHDAQPLVEANVEPQSILEATPVQSTLE